MQKRTVIVNVSQTYYYYYTTTTREGNIYIYTCRSTGFYPLVMAITRAQAALWVDKKYILLDVQMVLVLNKCWISFWHSNIF